jgi:outer membrane protein
MNFPAIGMAVLLVTLVPENGAAESIAGPLSVKEYVKIALEHNPQLRTAAAAVEQSSAGVEGSRAQMLPHFSGSVGVSDGGTVSPNSGSVSANAGVSGSLLLFDFSRTPLSYGASKKGLESALADQNVSVQSVIVLAQTAYFNYLLQRQIVKVNEDALKQTQDHLVQAQMLFDVGKQPQASVTKAQVDVANAQVALITARGSLRLARLQIEVAAGVTFADSITLTDTIDGTSDSVDRGTAIKTALDKRPEMVAANAQVASSHLLARAAALAYLPSISASGGYSWTKLQDVAGNQSWNVGASASIPIYQGGTTEANVRSANASVQTAEANRDAEIQTITTQVEQYLLNRSEALERIDAGIVLVKNATEGLQLSQEQYRAGIAAPLVVTDAEVTLANARITLAQARYDFHIAQVNLTQAMGILQP